ncbi:hypothetical protein DL96DRAFT_1016984 [Flagelloscypha sp. PMI_526]|nr:hypothetical protein DL96DRAFT_1016984 [Flagelloscypha sp. PMI_526]
MSHQALDQTPSSPSKPSNDDSQDLPPYSPYDDSPVSPTSSYPPTSPSSSLAPSAPVSPSTDKHEDPTNQDESHAEDNTLEEKLIDCTSVWNRVPPPELLCVSFTPTCTIPTYGNSLSKGFPAMPPHINVVPHPFTSNDVTDQDWKLFITHLQETARVTKKEKQKANSSIPMLGVIPLVGPAVRYGVRSYLASKKPASAGQVVDTWNRVRIH